MTAGDDVTYPIPTGMVAGDRVTLVIENDSTDDFPIVFAQGYENADGSALTHNAGVAENTLFGASAQSYTFRAMSPTSLRRIDELP